MSTNRIFIAFIFILSAIVLINRVLLCFSYYTDLGGIEETFLFYAQRFAGNLPIYTNPETPPFFLNQYSPLSTVFIGSIYKVLGLNPIKDIHALFVTGRVFQLLFNMAQGYVVFYILNNIFRLKKEYTILASCLVFLFMFSHNYAIRPDSLKSLFVIAYLASVILYLKHNSIKYLLVSSVLIALAVFTKQDAFGFYIGVILWAVIIGHYRSSAFLMFTGAITIWAAYLYCVLKSGDLFYLNGVIGLSQGINLSYFQKLLPYIIPELIAALAILGLLFLRRNEVKAKELNGYHLLVLAIIIFLPELLASLKFGASPVYFSDFISVAIIGIALVIANHQFLPGKQVVAGRLILFGLLVVHYTNGVTAKWFSPKDNNNLKQAYIADAFLSNRIRDNFDGKAILSLDKGLINHCYDIAFFPTYEAEFYELIEGKDITNDRAGLPNIIFNYTEAEVLIKEGNIKYVITQSGKQVPNFLGIDKLDYINDTTISNLTVYKLSTAN